MFPDVTFLGLDLYTWCLVLGVVSALVIFRIYADKKNLSAKLQNFCYVSAVLAVMTGYGSAVLFQTIYDFTETGVFKIGGATFFGGLIGGAAVYLTLYFTLGRKLCGKEVAERFRDMSSVAACSVALAHSIGRIGCLMAGCCYGKETTSPLGIFLAAVGKTVYPTQLYEAIFLLLLFAALSLVLFKTKFNGLYLYMIVYSVFRFCIEFLRDDHRGASIVPFLTPSQTWAVLLFLTGAVLLAVSIVREKRKTAGTATPLSAEQTEK